MLASFFLSLREGLEAALIIGVLLGTINKLNRPQNKPAIWYGTGAAMLVSIAVGVILNLLGASFEGRAEEIFEGITMLLAASLLTWMILWMRTQARQMSKKLESDVQAAVHSQNSTALFTLAFLAVIREGVELAFFLTAASISSTGTAILTGAALGLGSVIILAILLFNSLIRLDIAKFFQVTSVILIIFAAGLVAHGVHEFNEAGIIPPVIEHVWDINHLLDENSTGGELLKALAGYNGNPSLTEVIAYLVYFTALGLSNKRLFARNKKTSAQQVR